MKQGDKLYVFRQMRRIEYFFAVPSDSWSSAKAAIKDEGFLAQHQLFKTGRTFTSQPKRVETLDVHDCMLKGFTLTLGDDNYTCNASGTPEIFIDDVGHTTIVNGRCSTCMKMLNEGAEISNVDIAITEPYMEEE